MGRKKTRTRRTLQDIADAVGVSVNTVSRALNDQSGVNKKTRERIRAEAERQGYVPNAQARSLVLGSSRMIAAVVTQLSNPFYAELVSEIELRARAAGYTIMLLVKDESVEIERQVVQAALNAGVDAIIGVPVHGAEQTWRTVQQTGLPLVLIQRQLSDFSSDLIASNSRKGMRLATMALIERGARDIILVEEDLPIWTIDERIAGFGEAMQAAGLAVDEGSVLRVPARRTAQMTLPWQAEDSHALVSDLLAQGRRPDGFAVGNDLLALGVLRMLREHQLSVPDQVQVIGFGDHPFSGSMTPALSTVRMPARTLGELAINRVLAALDGEPLPGDTITLDTTVVLRGTTRRL